MEKRMIKVYSMSNRTIVVHVPSIPLSKTWTKKGSCYPIDSEQLMLAYYDPGVQYLFESGKLYVEDKEFLMDIGLLNEEGESAVVKLSDQYIDRLLTKMPITEMKQEIKKLSKPQLEEIADIIVFKSQNLTIGMDRIDTIGKILGRDLMKAITNYRQTQED